MTTSELVDRLMLAVSSSRGDTDLRARIEAVLAESGPVIVSRNDMHRIRNALARSTLPTAMHILSTVDDLLSASDAGTGGEE